MLEVSESRSYDYNCLQIEEIQRNSSKGFDLMIQILRLRKEVYMSLGWIIDPKKKAKMIHDEFDNLDSTIHFALFEGNRIIGAIRTIAFSTKSKLPLINAGVDLSFLNNTDLNSISEGSRLLVKQNRRYPGCALQLLFYSHFYALKNKCKSIYSVGNPSKCKLYSYVGYKIIDSEIDFILDKDDKGNSITVKGIPLFMNFSTINKEIDFDRYNIKRKMIVIKNE